MVGSERPLNNVEANRLKREYEEFEKRGLINGMIVPDENSNSGFRIVNSGVAEYMKAAAVGQQIENLEKSKPKNKVDLSALDPARFAQGTIADPAQVKEALKSYSDLAETLDSMRPDQRKAVLGENSWYAGRLNPFAKGSIFERVLNKVDQPYGTAAYDKQLKEVIDEAVNSAPDLTSEQKESLRKGLFELGKYNIKDDERNGTIGLGSNGYSFFQMLSRDAGADFIEIYKKLSEFGKSEKTLEELTSARDAYLIDAQEKEIQPYESDIDQANAEAERMEAATEAANALEGIAAALTKSDDKAKTPAQRELDALNEQWAEIEKKMEGVSDFDVLGEYYLQEQKLMEKRKELQEKINEELEKEQQKRAEEENKARTEERNAYLTGRFGDVVKAIANNDADAAKMNEGFFDSLLVNRKMFNGIDLSDFYRESPNLIKDSIEKTNVTLSSRSTMNTYEAMDMSRDVQIDVQKQQLAELRAANSTFRNIYAWMQQDEQYKEFI